MGCGSSKRLDCPLCNLVSSTSVDGLIRHVNAAHTLKCPNCSHSFGTGKELLDHHLREHVPEHVVHCPKCNRTAINEEELLNHLEEVHDFRSRTGTAVKSSKPEALDSRARSGPHGPSARYTKYSPEHVVPAHEELALRSEAMGVECPICKKRDFPTAPALVEHLQTFHSFQATEGHEHDNRYHQRNSFERNPSFHRDARPPSSVYRGQHNSWDDDMKEDEPFLSKQDVFQTNPNVLSQIASAPRGSQLLHRPGSSLKDDDYNYTKPVSQKQVQPSSSFSLRHEPPRSVSKGQDRRSFGQDDMKEDEPFLSKPEVFHANPSSMQAIPSAPRLSQLSHRPGSNILENDYDYTKAASQKPVQSSSSFSLRHEPPKSVSKTQDRRSFGHDHMEEDEPFLTKQEVFHSNPSIMPRVGSATHASQLPHRPGSTSLENDTSKTAIQKPVQQSKSFSQQHEPQKGLSQNQDRRSSGQKSQLSRSTSGSSSWSLKDLHRIDSDLSSPEHSPKNSHDRSSLNDDHDFGKKHQAQPTSARKHDNIDKLKIQTVDKLRIQTRSDRDNYKAQSGSSFGNQQESNYVHDEEEKHVNHQDDEEGAFASIKKNGRVRQRMKPLPMHPESPNLNDHAQGVNHDMRARSDTNIAIIPLQPVVKGGPRQDDAKRTTQKSENHFAQHHKEVHGNTRKDDDVPSIGEKVLASNLKLQWEFHIGRVLEVYPEKLEYKVQWGASERDSDVFDYENLALDRSPSAKEIGVGTIVLFSQGQRKNSLVSGGTVDASNLKWHQGIITRVYTDFGGIKRVDGHHTKNEKDGKSLIFPGYSHEFAGLALDMLRVSLNPYEILGTLEADHFNPGDERQVYDIFFACAQFGKYTWFRQDDNETQAKFHQPCDPIELSHFLKGKGFSLYIPSQSRQDIRKNVRAMRESKIYVACIDNDYAKSQLYAAQFHYAKSTLNMPMIPLLFAGQDKAWMQTTVGQALAKETCIAFENRGVQHEREDELLKALKRQDVVSEHDYEILEPKSKPDSSRGESKRVDVFISYCWANSFLAKQLGQVPEVHGIEFADPRLINKKLIQQGYRTWIDEKRIDQVHALRSQMVSALKSAKVLVPFISTEYAADPTCMAVLQYAIKSLKLPVIPVIVGQSDNWKSAIVGSLLSHVDREPLNVQHTNSDLVLNMRLKTLKLALDDIIKAQDSRGHVQLQSRTRAPRARDRVVCRYANQDYRMATVESVNARSLEYSVLWDDDDHQNRVQPFDKVALDIKPNAEDVGPGSVVFVLQNSAPSEGRLLQPRYLEGVISKVTKKREAFFVDGSYVKQEPSRNSRTPTENRQEFSDVPVPNLRIPTNMFDVVDSVSSN